MREGWKRIRLDDAAEVAIGRQRSPKHANGPHLLPYMRAANVKDGRLALSDVLTMNFDPKEQRTFGLRHGDVLVTEGCGSIGELGATARWSNDLPDPVCFQNTLLRLRARPGITLPGFVEQWSRWAHKSGIWAGVAGGTNIFHIGLMRAKEVPILLPPLAEQRRIVDLIAAVDATIESAERLVQESVIAETTLRDELFQRMVRYRAVALADLVEVRNGRQRSPRHAYGDHMLRYVRAANVKDARLVLDEPQYMNFTPPEQRRYTLRSGDVLVTEGCGSRNQIGASCEWRDEIPGTVCFQNHLLRLRTLDPDALHQRLVYHWALWAFRTGRFAEIATGTNIFSLGTGRVEKMDFPSVEVAEQDSALRVLEPAIELTSTALDVQTRLSNLRSALLSDLLSGEHEIPDSYDELLSA